MNEYARKMFRELEAKAAENGFLGLTPYFNAGARKTGAEILTIFYFKTMQDVHKFAFGDLHREGWNWYNQVSKKWPHLGIMVCIAVSLIPHRSCNSVGRFYEGARLLLPFNRKPSTIS